jgi:hypothetical protein
MVWGGAFMVPSVFYKSGPLAGKNVSPHIAASFILASGWPQTGRRARFL